MKTQLIHPNPRLAAKLRLIIALVALVIILFALLIAVPLAFDDKIGLGSAAIFFTIWSGVTILFALIGMILVGSYYRSLGYEVQEDEVIVNVGIITKSVKHVPYRTVTDITIKRGLLDRYLFNLGTLHIQTAGMSGQTGSEISMIGLDNVQTVYDDVVVQLHRLRGGMAPTTAEIEPGTAPTGDTTLAALLAEVRAIRQAVERS